MLLNEVQRLLLSLEMKLQVRLPVNLLYGLLTLPDLDCLTSSLLYAWIRSEAPPFRAFTPFYIPITNIVKADIVLRPEFSKVLAYANLTTDHLITLDDLQTRRGELDLLEPHQTKWVLVDHNASQGMLGKRYAHRVGGVIDHHQEENQVPQDTGSEPRIVENAGSCTSLVTNYVRESWTKLSSASHENDATELLWDAQVAKMALASILIDTVNLTDPSKVTKHDHDAVQFLEAKVLEHPTTANTYNRQTLYEEISGAKQEIGQLCLIDILRKDYKEWTENGKKLGISSVVKPLDFLLSKAGQEMDLPEADAFNVVIGKFCEQRHLDLYATMTAFSDDSNEFRRELFLRSSTDSCNSMAERFERDAKDELGLTAWDGARLAERSGDWQKAWKQGRTQQTRKQVSPLLREAMR